MNLKKSVNWLCSSTKSTAPPMFSTVLFSQVFAITLCTCPFTLEVVEALLLLIWVTEIPAVLPLNPTHTL